MNSPKTSQAAKASSGSPDYKRLDGREASQSIREAVKDAVQRLTEAGWPPRLISIEIGNNDAARVYIRNQKRLAESLGIAFEEKDFPADVTRSEMLAAIAAMNADPRVTGIIIQRPIPKHLSIRELQASVHPLKDVEGMHPASIGNIVYKDLALAPCTAAAAIALLKRTSLELPGLEVVVVGSSEIVGKPIAFMLMAEEATVTVCHHRTHNLAVHLRQADAVFVAVGKPNLITGAMIKPGAAVIDIGINQVTLEDGSTKIVGDVDYESCAEVAGWITPVPGGVGPVTVSLLMQNLVTAAQHQKQHYEKEYGSGGLPPLEYQRASS